MKNSKDKTELFETMPIPKAVAKLCIPSVMATMVMIIYSMSDMFFVGLINDAVQTAGVTLAAPVLLAFNAVTNLFGVGTSSKMSRSLGEKDYETVTKASAFGFYCSIICAALLSLGSVVFRAPLLNILGVEPLTEKATADYLFWTVSCGAVPAILNVTMGYLVRAEGSAMHASIGTMSGSLLNIILDPIFILPWGLNMGAAGAGLATCLSNCAACLYFAGFMIIKRGKTYVCINPAKFGFDFKIAKDIFIVGIPASIQNLLNVTGMTVLNNFTGAYKSAAAVAAMGISHKIALIPLYASMGLSQGIMPLISYNFASKNIKRMKEGFLFTLKISMAIITVLTILLCIFSAPVTSLFMKDAEVVAYGSAFLRGMGLALPFLCLDFIGVAVFQACGMGGKSFVFAVMRKLVLEIPALYVLNKLFPLYGLAYAQFVAEFVLAIAATIVLIRMFRRLEKEA